MSGDKEILARIERACESYPENFIAGYIISLLAGRPDETLLEDATVRPTMTKQGDLFDVPKLAVPEDTQGGPPDGSESSQTPVGHETHEPDPSPDQGEGHDLQHDHGDRKLPVRRPRRTGSRSIRRGGER